MDPVILHEPSHVSLHHLYAQSIRENMLVLSSTTRNVDLYLECLQCPLRIMQGYSSGQRRTFVDMKL